MLLKTEEFDKFKENHAASLREHMISYNKYKTLLEKYSFYSDFLSMPVLMSKIMVNQDNSLNRWINDKLIIDFRKLRYDYDNRQHIYTDAYKEEYCHIAENDVLNDMLNVNGYLENKVLNETVVFNTNEFINSIRKGSTNTGYYDYTNTVFSENGGSRLFIIKRNNPENITENLFNIDFFTNKSFTNSPNKIFFDIISDREVYFTTEDFYKSTSNNEIYQNYDTIDVSVGNNIENLLKNDKNFFVNRIDNTKTNYNSLVYFSFFPFETKKYFFIKRMELYYTQYDNSNTNHITITLPLNDDTTKRRYKYKFNNLNSYIDGMTIPGNDVDEKIETSFGEIKYNDSNNTQSISIYYIASDLKQPGHQPINRIEIERSTT